MRAMVHKGASQEGDNQLHWGRSPLGSSPLSLQLEKEERGWDGVSLWGGSQVDVVPVRAG